MLESCKQNSKITGVMFMYKCWVNPGFILTASWSSEVWKFWRCSVDGSELHVSLMEVRTCWAGWRCKATFSSRTRLNSALRAQLDFDCWLSLLFVCLRKREGWTEGRREGVLFPVSHLQCLDLRRLALSLNLSSSLRFTLSLSGPD